MLKNPTKIYTVVIVWSPIWCKIDAVPDFIMLKVPTMPRFSVSFSDQLNEAIDVVACESHTNKNEIIKKALTMYLEAKKGQQEEGLKIGLADPKTNELKREFIGL